jgi:hypothetical protein
MKVPGSPQGKVYGRSPEGMPSETDLMMALATMKKLGRIPEASPTPMVQSGGENERS